MNTSLPTRLSPLRTTRAAAAAVAVTGLCLTGCGAVAAGASAQATGRRAAPAAAAAPSWRIIKKIPGTFATGPAFSAITATSARDAWAFEASSAKPAAWRLTGPAWRRVPFPGLTGEAVTAAGSSSPANVWAFTTVPAGRSRALAWNGTRWTVVRQFTQAAIGGALVLGRHDVWAFGGGTWHYNGTSWTRYPSVPGLTAGSALSARDIWAAGGTVAAHWNGRAWTTTSLARLLPRRTLLCLPRADGVLARSPRDVWVAAAGGCQDERGPFVLLHYNGTQWRRVALLPRYGETRQIVRDGSGGLWIATIAGFPGDFTMLHYSGGHLRAVPMPLPASEIRVWSLAHVAGTTVTFGAGQFYPALPSLGKPAALILRNGG